MAVTAFIIRITELRKTGCQRRIQNLVKHLRWRVLQKQLKALRVNYFNKTFHLRYLGEFGIRFWFLLLEY